MNLLDVRVLRKLRDKYAATPTYITQPKWQDQYGNLHGGVAKEYIGHDPKSFRMARSADGKDLTVGFSRQQGVEMPPIAPYGKSRDDFQVKAVQDLNKTPSIVPGFNTTNHPEKARLQINNVPQPLVSWEPPKGVDTFTSGPKVNDRYFVSKNAPKFQPILTSGADPRIFSKNDQKMLTMRNIYDDPYIPMEAKLRAAKTLANVNSEEELKSLIGMAQ